MLPEEIKYSPVDVLPADFTVDGGFLNFMLRGNKLWLCFNGQAMIRVQGFDECALDIDPDDSELFQAVKTYLSDGLDESVKNDLWNAMIDLGYTPDDLTIELPSDECVEFEYPDGDSNA